MTREEIGRTAQTLIDTYNAKLMADRSINDPDTRTYINARLDSVIEQCLMMLTGQLSDEQKIPYTDRKLTELAIMESYLQDTDVAPRPTTPISLGLLRTLIHDRIEVWESSSDPFLVLHYDEVRRAFLAKRSVERAGR